MQDKTQYAIDGFVQRNYYSMSKDQLIGVVMMEWLVFYDEATQRVKQALNSLQFAKAEKGGE